MNKDVLWLSQSKKEYLNEFYALCEKRIEILEKEKSDLESLRGKEDEALINKCIFGIHERINEIQSIMLHTSTQQINEILKEKR